MYFSNCHNTISNKITPIPVLTSRDFNLPTNLDLESIVSFLTSAPIPNLNFDRSLSSIPMSLPMIKAIHGVYEGETFIHDTNELGNQLKLQNRGKMRLVILGNEQHSYDNIKVDLFDNTGHCFLGIEQTKNAISLPIYRHDRLSFLIHDTQNDAPDWLRFFFDANRAIAIGSIHRKNEGEYIESGVFFLKKNNMGITT